MMPLERQKALDIMTPAEFEAWWRALDADPEWIEQHDVGSDIDEDDDPNEPESYK